MDTIIKLSLIFFIALLSFSIGTYVGKQLSDKEYKKTKFNDEYKTLKSKDSDFQYTNGEEPSENRNEREVASLAKKFIEAEKKKEKEQEMKNEKASQENRLLTEKKEIQINQGEIKNQLPIQEEKKGYQVLNYKKKNETLKTSNLKDQKKGKNAISKKVSLLLKKDKPSQKDLIKKTSSPPKPIKESQIVKKQSLSQKVTRKEDSYQVKKMKSFPFKNQANYTIQVASYTDKSEAEKHVSQLKSKNYSAFYISATVKGKVWYRVNVGLYPTKKKARDFQRELKTEALVSASIIKRIVE